MAGHLGCLHCPDFGTTGRRARDASGDDPFAGLGKIPKVEVRLPDAYASQGPVGGCDVLSYSGCSIHTQVDGTARGLILEKFFITPQSGRGVARS